MTYKLRTPRLHPQAGENTASSTATHQNTTPNKFSHLEILYKVKLSSKYVYILMYSCAETIQHQKHLYGPAVEVENTHLTSPHEKTKPKNITEKNTENGKAIPNNGKTIPKDIFVLLC